MNHSAAACLLVAFLWFSTAGAGEIKLAETGFLIDAGKAGRHILTYPRLATPEDKSLKPENITLSPDGSAVTMAYTPSGKLVINRQTDGTWFFHFTEIPPDQVKFFFGIQIPPSVIEKAATWAFDDKEAQPFPATKDKVTLQMINPVQFIFRQNGEGFTISYPMKTFTTLTDQRVWGKPYFNLGHGFYFPGKKNVPEIDYSIRLSTLPSSP